MKWKENLIVKWGARLVGLAAATVGFAKQEPVAIAIFGAYLIWEFWLIDDKVAGGLNRGLESIGAVESGMQSLAGQILAKIEEALQFEYLNDASLIWGRAVDFLRNAQPNDEIRSTASTPNDPEFEKAIFERVIHDQLVYKRLLCYVPRDGEKAVAAGFPAIDMIKGATDEDLLTAYAAWYAAFFQAWQAIAKNGHIKEPDSLALGIWIKALEKLQKRLKRFEVRPHVSDIPSDYFIVNAYGVHHWRAVLGFPRLEGEGMRSGVATTNSRLANDLSLNWQRLWDRAPRL